MAFGFNSISSKSIGFDLSSIRWLHLRCSSFFSFISIQSRNMFVLRMKSSGKYVKRKSTTSLANKTEQERETSTNKRWEINSHSIVSVRPMNDSFDWKTSKMCHVIETYFFLSLFSLSSSFWAHFISLHILQNFASHLPMEKMQTKWFLIRMFFNLPTNFNSCCGSISKSCSFFSILSFY